MDFAFSDEQIILRDSVRKMMDRLATPDYVRRLDREQAYPDALYAAWVEMGLLRLPFAEEYGGLGGSALAAAGYCGGSQAAFELALSYAKDRQQFGRSIGTFQAIAHMLADLQTELEAARTLVWRAAWMVGNDAADALRVISMAKLFASETYVKIANAGMQIFGGAGYSMEFDMQRHFRDSRSTTIAAGTSQMQRNVIAGLMGLKVK